MTASGKATTLGPASGGQAAARASRWTSASAGKAARYALIYGVSLLIIA